MEVLGAKYRERGFQFMVEPPTEFVPDFLQGYRPDALALKDGEGVLIELKRQRTGRPDQRIAEVSRRLNGHPNWTLEVVFTENFVRERGWTLRPAEIRSASDAELMEVQEEIDRLEQAGNLSAAFLLGWSLLEAATRRKIEDAASAAREPMTSWQIVEWLTSLGIVEGDLVVSLRDLLRKRNALAHGDFSSRADLDDVQALKQILGRVAEFRPSPS
ncbi:hypothetical protein HJG44_01875 [Enterovirga sp. DB1703]|uniref:REase AHJR-like domain-containing protein n=2 Tax=Enterovirga aerilata TaxID=2730920 RepID=A0A849I188_9HYPH|nr:hypothetical protein [Enterovirga sp. DB1703]